MGNYAFSSRSVGRMEGIDSRLVAISKMAITRSVFDFGITCGLRTEAEQKALYAAKASQCDGVKNKSKHQSDMAVDVAVYIGPRLSWESNLYDEVCDAYVSAARQHGGVGLRWGGAWHIDNMLDYQGTAENATMEYVDLRRSQGRRPFMDSVHLEIFDL